MSRKQYPSDKERGRTKPFARLHYSVANHRKTAAAWSDLQLRGMLVELWRLGGEKYASETGDRLLLTASDLQGVTGAKGVANGRRALGRLMASVGYEWGPDGSLTWVKLRNFAKKNGFTPRTPHTPRSAPHVDSARSARSDADADTDAETLPTEESRPPRTPADSPPDSPLLNLLSKLDGDRAEKLAWLADTGPQIEVDSSSYGKAVPSLTVSYYRRYLAGERRFKAASEAADRKQRFREKVLQWQREGVNVPAEYLEQAGLA